MNGPGNFIEGQRVKFDAETGGVRHGVVDRVTYDRIWLTLTDNPRGTCWFDRHEMHRLQYDEEKGSPDAK